MLIKKKRFLHPLVGLFALLLPEQLAAQRNPFPQLLFCSPHIQTFNLRKGVAVLSFPILLNKENVCIMLVIKYRRFTLSPSSRGEMFFLVV